MDSLNLFRYRKVLCKREAIKLKLFQRTCADVLSITSKMQRRIETTVDLLDLQSKTWTANSLMFQGLNESGVTKTT